MLVTTDAIQTPLLAKKTPLLAVAISSSACTSMLRASAGQLRPHGFCQGCLHACKVTREAIWGGGAHLSVVSQLPGYLSLVLQLRMLLVKLLMTGAGFIL